MRLWKPEIVSLQSWVIDLAGEKKNNKSLIFYQFLYTYKQIKKNKMMKVCFLTHSRKVFILYFACVACKMKDGGNKLSNLLGIHDINLL